MIQAIEKVMNDFPDVFSFGDGAQRIHSYGLIEEESVLKERWIAALAQVLETAQITIPQTTGVKSKNGRNGEHSVELEEALEILGEVYHQDTAAAW